MQFASCEAEGVVALGHRLLIGQIPSFATDSFVVLSDPQIARPKYQRVALSAYLGGGRRNLTPRLLLAVSKSSQKSSRRMDGCGC